MVLARTPLTPSLLRRSCITFAALLVKVRANILAGSTPLETKCLIRSIITLVLPDPGPALTKSNVDLVWTALS